MWIDWSSEHHDEKWANTLKSSLKKDFIPTYGNWLIKDFRCKHAMMVLEEKTKTAPGQARNLHKAQRGTWEYAVDHELSEFNPFKDLKTAKKIPSMKEAGRERYLSDDEIKFFGIRSYPSAVAIQPNGHCY